MCVEVTNVCVLDNPARFENPFQVSCARPRPALDAQTAHTLTLAPRSELLAHLLHSFACARVCVHLRWNRTRSQFEVSFECLAPIADDVEWSATGPNFPHILLLAIFLWHFTGCPF